MAAILLNMKGIETWLPPEVTALSKERVSVKEQLRKSFKEGGASLVGMELTLLGRLGFEVKSFSLKFF